MVQDIFRHGGRRANHEAVVVPNDLAQLCLAQSNFVVHLVPVYRTCVRRQNCSSEVRGLELTEGVHMYEGSLRTHPFSPKMSAQTGSQLSLISTCAARVGARAVRATAARFNTVFTALRMFQTQPAATQSLHLTRPL